MQGESITARSRVARLGASVVVVLTLTALVASPCEAQGAEAIEESGVARPFQATTPGAATDDWQFDAEIVFWLAQTTGDMTVGLREIEFHLPFRTALDDLGGVFFGHFEARKRRVGVATDLMWARIKEGGFVSATLPDGTPADADLQVGVLFWELWPHYRVVDGNNAFDVFGGIRYTALKPKFTLHDLGTTIDDTIDWVDPMFGGRWIGRVSETITVQARGDVAGFGVGSEFTWNIQGDVNWRFHPILGLAIGYRVLNIDYEEGTAVDPDFAKLDVTLHGLLLGFTAVW